MVALSLWMRFTMVAVLGAGVFLPTALSGQGEAGGTLPGCYDVRVGTWEGMAGDQPDSLLYSPPSRIILDSVSPLEPRFDGERAVRVAPDALPSIHELMSWTVSNDTLILGFSTGFTGFVARLPLSEEGLRGRASTFTDVMPSPRYSADFQLVPVDCDTPPSPSLADQRFVFRSLELPDGSQLRLGRELIYQPSWRRKEGKVSAWIDNTGTRRFPTAQEIRVSPNRQGLISTLVLRLSPDTPFEPLVARLAQELGPPVGWREPGGSDMESEFVSWGNRTTNLILTRSRFMGGEWQISLLLSDPRLGL